LPHDIIDVKDKIDQQIDNLMDKNADVADKYETFVSKLPKDLNEVKDKLDDHLNKLIDNLNEQTTTVEP